MKLRAANALAILAGGVLLSATFCTTVQAQQLVPKPRTRPEAPPAAPAIEKKAPTAVSRTPVAREPDEAAATETVENRAKLEQCIVALKRLGASVKPVEPFETEGGCRIDDPVALTTVRVAGAGVTLTGAPKLSCRFALKFVDWTVNVVAPVARYHLGSDISTLLTGPGYVCRRRNNAARGKLSEHAFGNAIDITGMGLRGGKRVMIGGLSGAPGSVKRFVGAMRVSACGYFTTVLGPGANAAHEGHIHVDLGRHGKTDRYRICQ